MMVLPKSSAGATRCHCLGAAVDPRAGNCPRFLGQVLLELRPIENALCPCAIVCLSSNIAGNRLLSGITGNSRKLIASTDDDPIEQSETVVA